MGFHAFHSSFTALLQRRRIFLTLVAGLLAGAVLAPIVASAALDSRGSVYDPRTTQCVLFDTRVSQGGSGAIAGGGTRTFTIMGDLTTQGGQAGCAVSDNATGYHLNLVAVAATGGGNLKAWPADEAEPAGGIVNYQGLTPNMNNANAFMVAYSASGLKVKANGATVDVRGILYGDLSDAPSALASDRILYGRAASSADGALLFEWPGTGIEVRTHDVTEGDSAVEVRILNTNTAGGSSFWVSNIITPSAMSAEPGASVKVGGLSGASVLLTENKGSLGRMMRLDCFANRIAGGDDGFVQCMGVTAGAP